MGKFILIIAAILGTIFIAYSMGKKQEHGQINALKAQLNALNAQLEEHGIHLDSSYHRLHRSLNLHMAESSIEAALHETLDQNFGQAKIAVESARKYLVGAAGKEITPSDIKPITDNLNEVSDQLEHLDKEAVKSLNEADRRVRELILKNSR